VKARTTQIVGWGKYVPERRLTNQDLEGRMDTSDEWIRSRTGIRERRIVSQEETSATMAIRAGASALRVAGIGPRRVDLIIVATITPDHLFPSTACLVQAALGAGRAAAFDMGAACTGFVYALGVANDMIRSGTYDNALVIATETLSRIVDPMDRNTCVLFGDGAGAVVLQAAQGNGGILSVSMGSDGSGAELLIQPAGGSRFPATRETVEEGLHYVKMNGKAIFRFATHVMPRATREAVRKAGFRVEDVALVIPHQANVRIIEAAMKRLQLPPDRAYLNLEGHRGREIEARRPGGFGGVRRWAHLGLGGLELDRPLAAGKGILVAKDLATAGLPLGVLATASAEALLPDIEAEIAICLVGGMSSPKFCPIAPGRTWRRSFRRRRAGRPG